MVVGTPVYGQQSHYEQHLKKEKLIKRNMN